MVDIVADIGATNARFGLMAEQNGVVEQTHVLKCEDYLGFAEAYRAYCDLIGMDHKAIKRAAAAIAGPITRADLVRMTNHPWAFSRSATQKELGLSHFVVVNDFTAVALSLSALKGSDLVLVGEKGRVDVNAPRAVLGAGTGLGVSGLIPDGKGGFIPLSGEGGHVTMSPYNDREAAVLHILRDWFGHVSAERLICGSGLVNLYRALATLEQIDPRHTKPDQITIAACDENEALSTEALTMFCAMLGTVAGNLALTLGARGGVYIAGGIVPRILPFFQKSPFRNRFKAKGRFENYNAGIPTYVVTHAFPAFVGLEAALNAK